MNIRCFLTALVCALTLAALHGQNAGLMPVPKVQILDANGDPLTDRDWETTDIHNSPS